MYNPNAQNVIVGQAALPGGPSYPPFFPGQGGSSNHQQRPEGITPEMPVQLPPGSTPGFPGNSQMGNNMGPGMGSGGTMPLSAPPQLPPARNNMARAVDPGSIRNCLGRFTYIWLDNGNEFWMYPLQVGRTSVSGFRWNRNFGWIYFGVALNRIDFFTCV